MNADSLQLSTRLDLPPRGGSARMAVGGNELVFEAVRGGYTLLWHAGREARRYVVGLCGPGSLHLELRAPRYPVKLLLQETLALAPRARVRGYVQVPLVPTLLWRDADGVLTQLLDFTPAGLAAEWSDSDQPLQCCTSPWLVRFPVHTGEPRAIVPLLLKNGSDAVCSPADLPCVLRAGDLHELRGRIVAPPRRLQWDGASWQGRSRHAVEVSR